MNGEQEQHRPLLAEVVVGEGHACSTESVALDAAVSIPFMGVSMILPRELFCGLVTFTRAFSGRLTDAILLLRGDT